ncbi:MAG: Dabb family protein [Saprospiraceae bacterium]|nr:Dabb family protein [Saprospiraceae bacterium]
MDRPGFVHSVYFWLKEEVSEDQRTAFSQGLQALNNCPTVRHSFIGPSAGTPREVVDNSYDFALLVFFDNKVDHDAYQEDEIHHEFIDKYKDMWARVQIYDHLPA